jgi:tRNA(Ile)-lysidine synthase
MEALDGLAEDLLAQARDPDGLVVARLDRQPDALVGRVLRLAALDAGAPGSELFQVHVRALGDLLRGSLRGEVQLPGHLTAYRAEDHLRFRRTAVGS